MEGVAEEAALEDEGEVVTEEEAAVLACAVHRGGWTQYYRAIATLVAGRVWDTGYACQLRGSPQELEADSPPEEEAASSRFNANARTRGAMPKKS